MTRTVFVAGGTSILGRSVIRRLEAQGYSVITLTRSLTAAEEHRANGIRVHQADALRPFAPECMEGVDAVISCLGNSVRPEWGGDRRAYTRFDVPANRNLIEAAQRANVKRFVYVSAFGAHAHPKLDYMNAHAQVEALLDRSGLPFSVLRPTGFFSAFDAILELAGKGAAPLLGDGAARTNPIHDADLANALVESLEAPSGARDLGGPEVLTRRQIAELAFVALGKPQRIRQVPAWAALIPSVLLRPFNPRLAHLMAFAEEVFTKDCVAPACGQRTLGEYFRQRVAATPAPPEPAAPR